MSPTYVSSSDTLASISGATNAVEIESSNLVRTTYTGQGAGRFPTANSCVNDIVKVAREDVNMLPFNVPVANVSYSNDFKSKFYVRIRYSDQNGITSDCGMSSAKNGIGIYSILQNPIRNRDDACFVITTDSVERSKIVKFVQEIEGYEWCMGKVFFMPILRDDEGL